MTKGDKELALVFGGAGALLLVYLFWPKTVTAAPAAAASNNNVVLQPGSTTIAPALNSQVTLTLPPGAAWASADPVTAEGSPIAGTNVLGTFTFTATDDVQLVASWFASLNSAQINTTINVVPPGS